MKKVGVVGYGVVGRSMVEMFGRAHDVSIYDKKMQLDKSAVLGVDLAVVCVPTPQKPSGSADVSAVEEVVGWLDADLILIKSTVPPGTVDRLVRETGKSICFSPEYIGEPRNFVQPWMYPDPDHSYMHDWVIVGGERASEVLDFFLPILSTDASFIACRAVEAELTKYMENTWLATKVTFCNEWARIAEVFGVDYKTLRELWLNDPRVDGSHTLVHPDAPGFGGKCLPKDTNAIVAASTVLGYNPKFLRELLRSNERYKEGEETC